MKKCKKVGHVYDQTKNRTCPECKRKSQNVWSKQYREKNREKLRNRAREWARDNQHVLNDYAKSHPEIVKKAKQKWKDLNPEKTPEAIKNWKKNNRHKLNFYGSRRRAIKAKAMPLWLNENQLAEIREFYTLAKELQWLSEEPLHVDHIIPLQGENVCGLHVPWNLQILPRSHNCKKSNKVDNI